jgi:hypothetical protein
MRILLSLAALLLVAALMQPALAQPPGQNGKPAIQVLLLEFPANIQLGEEFTLTAPVRNPSNDLQVVNVRLIVPPQLQLLAPSAEQIIILEAQTAQSVRWRLKRVGMQAFNVTVHAEPVVFAKPANATLGLKLAAADQDALGQRWQGIFTDKRGNEYQAVLTLQFNADKTLHGRIDWKLTKSQRADYQSKLGLTGVEYVWGVFDPGVRLLGLEGYRRDDPHGILGLDKYLLTLGNNGATLAGKTWDHGSWDGRLDLTPVGK